MSFGDSCATGLLDLFEEEISLQNKWRTCAWSASFQSGTPQYWLDKCSSLLPPFYHTVSDKRRWEVPRDEAMLTIPHSLHAIPHLCISVYCCILWHFVQLHATLYVQFQCILRGPNNESTQMVYWCVARQTHHLTVPTVPYFMSRTNLSVHSLTFKSLCAKVCVCVCLLISLVPRPHPTHVRRSLVSQARILGLFEQCNWSTCSCFCYYDKYCSVVSLITHTSGASPRI